MTAKRIRKPKDFQPEPKFPKGHHWAGKNRCQAWTANQGRQCGKQSMKGLRVCRTHGGASLRGIAHPNFKHGRDSIYKVAGLAKANEDWRKDAARISVVDEMELARSLIVQNLEAIEEVGGLPDWAEARALFDKASRALDNNRAADAERFLQQLGQLLKQGKDASAAQQRLMGGMEQVRRLVDTERQINADKGEYMQRSLVLALLADLQMTIRESVGPLQGGDRALRSIADRVRQFIGVLE